MICDHCSRSVEVIVDCPCGVAICHGCYEGHDCGQQERAHLRTSERTDKPTIRELVPRPYQQAAIDSILEALGDA